MQNAKKYFLMLVVLIAGAVATVLAIVASVFAAPATLLRLWSLKVNPWDKPAPPLPPQVLSLIDHFEAEALAEGKMRGLLPSSAISLKGLPPPAIVALIKSAQQRKEANLLNAGECFPIDENAD